MRRAATLLASLLVSTSKACPLANLGLNRTELQAFLNRPVPVQQAGHDFGVAPDLQPSGPSDPTGAFRGALGACESDAGRGLYHGYVKPGDNYYCNIAAVEIAFQKAHYPNDELCDWGFGELPPRPYVDEAGSVQWLPQADWSEAPGNTPGTDGPATMFQEFAKAQALFGGSTAGSKVARQFCALGVSQYCDPMMYNGTLSYPTSMAVWKIDDKLPSVLQQWRDQWHRPNINFGTSAHYYAGWARKVVRCRDVPVSLRIIGAAGGFLSPATPMPLISPRTSQIEYAAAKWREAASLLTTADLEALHATSFVSPADFTGAPETPLAPVSLAVVQGGANLTLTLDTGHLDRWVAVGLNARQMADAPVTLVVHSNGTLEQRVLARYAGGQVQPLSFAVHENTVADGRRTVVFSMTAAALPLSGAGSVLPYIWAVGPAGSVDIWSGHSAAQNTSTTVKALPLVEAGEAAKSIAMA